MERVAHRGPSLTDGGISGLRLDCDEQTLGLTWTPSRVQLEDIEKESREKGYSTGKGYGPEGKIHTSSEESEMQVFSWLVGH